MHAHPLAATHERSPSPLASTLLVKWLNRIVVVGFGAWAILLFAFSFIATDLARALNPYANYLVMLSIFSMGLTLDGRDFLRVIRQPRGIVTILISDYLVATIAAWIAGMLVYILLMNNPTLFVGQILQGAGPGGAASAIQTWVGRGDAALTVSATAVDTLVAPLLLPLVTWLFAGAFVQVPVLEMVVQTAQLAVLPVLAALIIKRLATPQIAYIEPVLPAAGVLCLWPVFPAILAPAVPVLLRQLEIIPLVALAGTIQVGIAAVLAYFVGALAGVGEAQRRSIMFDTTTQNSGLVAVLAAANFGPLAVVPAAVYAVIMNVFSFALAGYYRANPDARLPGVAMLRRVFPWVRED
ncbi:MAG TPA: hypothetical protein VKZ60_17870 [Chloroflexota bacterium]|nr:hypothetical protein [Chloroflexota bacterium]